MFFHHRKVFCTEEVNTNRFKRERNKEERLVCVFMVIKAARSD